MRDLAVQHGLTAEELSEHWVAHAANGSRELTEASCDEWATKLAVSKGKGGVVRRSQDQRKLHTKQDLADL